MGIKVKTKGFKEGEAELHAMAKAFPEVTAEVLQEFGDENVAWLQGKILTNGFGLPPKARDNGLPPLVDSMKYVRSFKASVLKLKLQIASEGMNDHMSNADLGEVLEYGGAGQPPRPHLRPFVIHLRKQVPTLGERIFRRVLRRIGSR